MCNVGDSESSPRGRPVSGMSRADFSIAQAGRGKPGWGSRFAHLIQDNPSRAARPDMFSAVFKPHSLLQLFIELQL